MKYIQSFYPYPVTFSAIGKTIPARNAEGQLRNILPVSDEEAAALQNAEPMFRALVERKKYRVLDHLPQSYKPPATLINEAQGEAEKLAAENASLDACVKEEKERADALAAENASLKEQLAAMAAEKKDTPPATAVESPASSSEAPNSPQKAEEQHKRGGKKE